MKLSKHERFTTVGSGANQAPEAKRVETTLASFDCAALVEVAAPVVIKKLKDIRQRREAGSLDLTPGLVVQMSQLSQAGQQLLALAGAEAPKALPELTI